MQTLNRTSNYYQNINIIVVKKIDRMQHILQIAVSLNNRVNSIYK